jgi:hypothetical protein
MSLKRRPYFIALEEQIEGLTEDVKRVVDEEAGPELQVRQYKLYKEWQRLTLEELKSRRRSQISKPPVPRC